MALPGYLGQGLLSVYGIGSNVGVQGIVAPVGYVFNTINAIWDGDSIAASVGDSILYKESDVVCILAWDNGKYPLIPVDKIIFTEDPSPP